MSKNGLETEVRQLKKRYWMALALFFISSMVCVSLLRTMQVQEKTNRELLRASDGLKLLKGVNINRRMSLAQLKSHFLADGKNASVEKLIYARIDDLKTRFKPNDLTIASIEKKGEEVTLNYTLKFLNPDFNYFLNTVNALEEIDYPLTVVSSVSITRSAAKDGNVLSCAVSGKVLAFSDNSP
jgi:hypothetical protein